MFATKVSRSGRGHTLRPHVPPRSLTGRYVENTISSSSYYRVRGGGGGGGRSVSTNRISDDPASPERILPSEISPTNPRGRRARVEKRVVYPAPARPTSSVRFEHLLRPRRRIGLSDDCRYKTLRVLRVNDRRDGEKSRPALLPQTFTSPLGRSATVCPSDKNPFSIPSSTVPVRPDSFSDSFSDLFSDLVCRT